MKAWGRGVCLGACAAIGLLAIPSTASAKPGYFVLSPHIYLAFTAHGSNGYKIEVMRSGKHLEVWVGRLGRGLAKYRAPARTRPGTIEANLGKLGRIDLRFDPKSVEVDPKGPKGCHGKPSVYELGTFSGTMRFRGEGGYTRFAAARVHGSISHVSREVCKKPNWMLHSHRDSKPAKEQDDGVDREITKLGAAKSNHSRSVFVGFVSIVVPQRPGQKRLSLVGATAEVHERRGRISIERSDLILPKEGALKLGSAAEALNATLTLPPPFAGSATYATNAAGAPTWSGSLRVALRVRRCH